MAVSSLALAFDRNLAALGGAGRRAGRVSLGLAAAESATLSLPIVIEDRRENRAAERVGII